MHHHPGAPAIAPEPDNVYRSLTKSSRVLWLRDQVTDENMTELAAEMHRISQKTSEDIYLFINSPGGSVTAGLLLVDMMSLIPNDIVTIGIGQCASMGQLLLTVGTPGKRFITPNARVLLHQPSGGFGGTTSDITTQASLINKMKDQLAALTASRTGKTIDEIHRDGNRDSWYTAEEALEYGFVDHVATSLDAINTILVKGGAE